MNDTGHELVNLKPYHDLTDFPPKYPIQVNNCGIKQNYPIPQDVLRPNGRHDYSILYQASGWSHVNTGSDIIRLEAGNCIIYMPGAWQLTSFSPDAGPTVYYVYFTGTAVREIMSRFNIRESLVFTVESAALFKTLFCQMTQLFRPLKAINGRQPVFDLTVIGLLFQVLDILLRSMEKKEKPERSVILPAVTYMGEHYHEQINLEQYARIVNLSVGRFAHLFTTHIGISPYRYILSLRMDEARELLENTSMGINDISVQVGFNDPGYFSRLFRKNLGCSPKEYRDRAVRNARCSLEKQQDFSDIQQVYPLSKEMDSAIIKARKVCTFSPSK